MVSPEPVLLPDVVRLIRAVADHCAGTFADVMRLAVPPRHAATERAAPRATTQPITAVPDGPLRDYPDGPGFLDALQSGGSPRAHWQVLSTHGARGAWSRGLVQAVGACLASGRSALIVVPDAKDLTVLATTCAELLGPQTAVQLTADDGPAARYRSFLAAARGQAKVVIGTRSAAFAPVTNLGLVALWDDGDDLHAEPRAPYPHVRDVLAIRAAQSRCAFLAASHNRSCEMQQFIERGWLRPLAFSPSAGRRHAPLVRVASDTDRALDADPAAHVARMPHDVFTTVRAGLSRGPVLMQVARSGYSLALVCEQCRTPVRCPRCTCGMHATRGSTLECPGCGHLDSDWSCGDCHSRQWRAPVVGAERTTDELGRAFPMTVIRRSSGDRVLAQVDEDADLVVATPGAEPVAADGYAAAVLLDTELMLWRDDLRAEEEALRRWLAAVARVRPASEDGTVMLVGPLDAVSVQALVRHDPAGFAARELDHRRSARMAPACPLVEVSGTTTAVGEFLGHLDAQIGKLEHERLGPVDDPDDHCHLLLRCAPEDRRALTAAVKAAVATRSAHKEGGGLRVVVDPVHVG